MIPLETPPRCASVVQGGVATGSIGVPCWIVVANDLHCVAGLVPGDSGNTSDRISDEGSGMIARSILCVVVVASLAATGCHVTNNRCHSGPRMIPQAPMDSCGCGATSCNSCSQGLSVRHQGCEGCGSMDCGGCGGARGPIHHLRQLTRQSVCGAGCGEIYWGEWLSDPPDCCDPCGGYGQYTGGRWGCGPRGFLSNFFTGILGTRHGGGCGCSDCASSGGMIYSGETIELPMGTQPDLAPQPIPGSQVRANRSQPTRATRQVARIPMSDPKPLGTGVRQAGHTRR